MVKYTQTAGVYRSRLRSPRAVDAGPAHRCWVIPAEWPVRQHGQQTHVGDRRRKADMLWGHGKCLPRAVATWTMTDHILAITGWGAGRLGSKPLFMTSMPACT